MLHLNVILLYEHKILCYIWSFLKNIFYVFYVSINNKQNPPNKQNLCLLVVGNIWSQFGAATFISVKAPAVCLPNHSEQPNM